MDLLWPGLLPLLLLIPLLIGVYIWVLRRRRRFAVRFSSLALVHAARPGDTRLRRHLPFALFLLALTSLILAMGRPVTVVHVPAGRATIVLALDVSRSMCSTDIPPNRLQAAEDAAIAYVQNQGSGTQIAIVAFAGFAELIAPPTNDVEILEDAITSLTTGRRTAIGSAILESLDVIAEIDPNVAPSVRNASTDVAPTPVPQGAYVPNIVVLLTDGASNAGPLPLEAAQQAADRGVRIYPIGFGTAQGGMMDCGDSLTDPWGRGGGWGGGGGGFRRGIDEETLQQVADLTGGEYFAPESADELHAVFRELPASLITRAEITEVSAFFALAGALLAAVAVGLALRWNPLP